MTYVLARGIKLHTALSRESCDRQERKGDIRTMVGYFLQTGFRCSRQITSGILSELGKSTNLHQPAEMTVLACPADRPSRCRSVMRRRRFIHPISTMSHMEACA